MLHASVCFALLLASASAASCPRLAGKWFDESSDDWMHVTESNCEMTTKYGVVRVADTAATPVAGILRTLGITGEYSDAVDEIKWSNGVLWRRLEEQRTGVDAATEARLVAAEARVTQLETVVQELRSRLDTVGSQVVSVGTCSGCPLTGGTAAPPATNAPATGTPPQQTPVPPGSTALPATPAPPTPTPPTPAPSTPTPPTPPGPAAGSAELQELRDLIMQVNESVANVQGTPGRDGYCSFQPNVTWVYTPLVRYVRRRNIGDICVTGPAAPVGPPGGVGVPNMVALREVTNQNCRWTRSMQMEPMYAYVGDTLVFWRGFDKSSNIFLMKDEQHFKDCDFVDAELLAGLLDLEGMETSGKNFTYTPSKAGVYYFASDKSGTQGVERKEYCWNPQGDGPYKTQAADWGRGVKIEVRVLDPVREVMAQCPLYDPSKYGVTSSGQQVDSASVERLKGAVGAITRQLIAYEVRTQERVRAQGNSGLTVTRSRRQGTDPYFVESYVGTGPANMHNHADFKYTIGMGEFGAVLNGVQFTTRHNDYSMLQPDDTLTVEQYIGSWPPKSRELDFPPVPPSVTGTVDEQIKEMREYFRAFHNQDKTIRDYEKYFKANLCYLEGTWAEAQDNVVEPFASDRHHIDANTWEELNNKVNFLFNNGQKDQRENLPYLPTSFRSIIESKTGDVFEPRIGQWFYRINCVPINENVSTKRFRVKNDMHVQMSVTKPQTREQVGMSNRALFDLHPAMRGEFDPTGPWTKGSTYEEYIDQLMENVPGFDGPKAFLEDRSLGPLCGTYNGSTTLNTARYTRYYSMLEKDAMGNRQKKRGFNDYMFAAQTTHPKVSPQEACHELAGTDEAFATDIDKERFILCRTLKDRATCGNHKQWGIDEVEKGATSAKCVWDGTLCRYKKCWSQRWSYAIPLEIVYTTPLSNWNPYDINYYNPTDPGYGQVQGGGATGRSIDAPLQGSNKNKFFRIPESFFKDQVNPDPADTSGGVTFVKNKNGEAKRVRASGHWVIFPEIEGVGSVRQRYPIMPVHEHGSSSWKEVKAVEELIMGSEITEIKNIIAETRLVQYGAVLKLLAGGGHEHTVYINPFEVNTLKTKSREYHRKLTTVDSGHAHFVEIRYNFTAPLGQELYMTWCTTMNTGDWDPCYESVKNSPDKCGTGGRLGNPCCYDRCPDGHPGVVQM